MSCSARPITTAPTAVVANTRSWRMAVAAIAEQDDDDAVLDDGGESIGEQVGTPRVDGERDERVDRTEREEQRADESRPDAASSAGSARESRAATRTASAPKASADAISRPRTWRLLVASRTISADERRARLRRSACEDMRAGWYQEKRVSSGCAAQEVVAVRLPLNPEALIVIHGAKSRRGARSSASPRAGRSLRSIDSSRGSRGATDFIRSRPSELKTYDWRLARTADPGGAPGYRPRRNRRVQPSQPRAESPAAGPGRAPFTRCCSTTSRAAPAKLVVYDVNFAEADTRSRRSTSADHVVVRRRIRPGVRRRGEERRQRHPAWPMRRIEGDALGALPSVPASGFRWTRRSSSSGRWSSRRSRRSRTRRPASDTTCSCSIRTARFVTRVPFVRTGEHGAAVARPRGGAARGRHPARRRSHRERRPPRRRSA